MPRKNVYNFKGNIFEKTKLGLKSQPNLDSLVMYCVGEASPEMPLWSLVRYGWEVEGFELDLNPGEMA